MGIGAIDAGFIANRFMCDLAFYYPFS